MSGTDDWDRSHDGMCPAFIGDGECRCHVSHIRSLKADRDVLHFENKRLRNALREIVEDEICTCKAESPDCAIRKARKLLDELSEER